MVDQFCANLRRLRGSRSQAEFARMLGTKQTTYSGWEVGNREPDLSMLCHISEVTGKTTDQLLGIKPLPATPDLEAHRVTSFKKDLIKFIKDY